MSRVQHKTSVTSIRVHLSVFYSNQSQHFPAKWTSPFCPAHLERICQSWRWLVKCKTDLIRKVTNFNEKNACRLVFTELDCCYIYCTSFFVLICWPWSTLVCHQSGIRFSLWDYFWCIISCPLHWCLTYLLIIEQYKNYVSVSCVGIGFCFI